MQGLTPEQSESLRHQLEVLRENYGVKLREKVGVIRGLWLEYQDMEEGEARQDLLKVLHRNTHSLAGSGATFGYAGAGEAARDAEVPLKALLDGGDLYTPAVGRIISAALDRLESEAGSNNRVNEEKEAEGARSAEALSLEGTFPEAQRIYFFFHETKLPDWLTGLATFGFDVRTFTSIADLAAESKSELPSLIIVQCTSNPLNIVQDGVPLSSALSQICDDEEQAVPVLWCCEQDDLVTRLQSVRAGGSAFMRCPANLDVLLPKINTLTSQITTEPFRILVVDDEPALARLYALVLRQAGMTAQMVTEPLKVMEPLVEFKPDLILMDVYMPGCSGLELAAVIRQHEAFMDIPIIFLSIEQDVSSQLEAMRRGGDDFLVKPLQPKHLVSAVATRASRARGLRQLMQRDALTGLWSHNVTREQLAVELDRARRLGHPLAVALLDVDDLAGINSRHGHAAGDHVLRSLARLFSGRLRQTDVIGRFGGDEFLVIMNNSSVAAAQRVVEGMRATFGSLSQSGATQFRATFSAGIATSPPHAKADELVEAAEAALHAAKEAGGNKSKLSDNSDLWSKREPL